MDLLLDTCTLLWVALGSPKLSTRARDLITDPSNRSWVSAVSAWEIVVKHGLGRLPLPSEPDAFVQEARQRHLLESLALTEADVGQTVRLSWHHRDPFDRLLIGQAIAQGAVLVTPDPLITRYPVRTVW